MKVRSQYEIQSLDDELNLFEENDWDFMSVIDTQGNNYEYFNDIRDTDFDIRKVNPVTLISYVALATSILAMMLIVVLKVTNVFDDAEWRELNSIQSVQGGGVVTQISGGEQATPEELIEVSNLLGSYLRCTQSRNEYHTLDAYCVGNSQFAKKYYDSVNSVITIYDINDCYARGLREFAAMYNISRINQVLKKDGIYYCYVTVEYPTIYDVSEFIQMNNQTFVKKFQGGYDINEASVAKFLLEVITESPPPKTTSDICLKVQSEDGDMMLVDDEFMLSMASDDYSVAVNQVLKSLDSLLTS